jgi:hypothetical protein
MLPQPIASLAELYHLQLQLFTHTCARAVMACASPLALLMAAIFSASDDRIT